MNQWSTAQIYPVMKQKLNERDRRLYFATEALKIGHGGISQIQRLSGVSRVTIARGVLELQTDSMEKDRIRKAGGGRKKATVKYPHIKQELSLLTHAKGDPMKRLLWTTKSIVKLSEELHKKHYVLHPVNLSCCCFGADQSHNNEIRTHGCSYGRYEYESNKDQSHRSGNGTIKYSA